MKTQYLSFLIVSALILISVSVFTCISSPAREEIIVYEPGMNFINQNGILVNPERIQSKYAIVAFFFTSCPTICPVMLKQMKRVQAAILVSDKYKILFYTIDPDRDTPARLSRYSDQHRLNSSKFWLLSGSRENIEKLGYGYALRGGPDKNDSTSFMHDGTFLLINNRQHTVINRYLGTESSSVDDLIKQIRRDL